MTQRSAAFTRTSGLPIIKQGFAANERSMLPGNPRPRGTDKPIGIQEAVQGMKFEY